jgi:Protein of unknown function (DUF3455)
MNKFKSYHLGGIARKLNESSRLRTALAGLGLALIFTLVSANAQGQVRSGAVTQSAAGDIIVPPVPDDLKIDAGNEVFLLGHGVGTQNYICKPVGAGFRFVLFTPQATLFKENNKQIITHFFGPNPEEANADPTVVSEHQIRVAWQALDSSSVWAKLHQPNGAVIVDETAVPWLKLDAVGHQNGPTGGDTLSNVTFIQRLNTTGGVAPRDGCTVSTDVGNQAFIPYTADYFFYRKIGGSN